MEGYSITGSPGKLDICRNLYYYLPQISIMARFVQNLIRNPEIFRTLPYLELEEYSESCQASTSSIFQESCVTLAYLESWYIQNLTNIQNPVKHLWCNVFLMNHGIYTISILFRTLCKYNIYRLMMHSKLKHIQIKTFKILWMFKIQFTQNPV